MSIDPELVLNELKDGINCRRQRTLDVLNEILRKHYESGEVDFSITNIGRLSEAAKGPSYSTIRATKNADYRRLIEVWAAKAGTNTKKPLAQNSRSRDIPTDVQLLKHINDPVLRQCFGQIIAERDRLKKENHLLKQQEIIVDHRPVRYSANTNQVEILGSLSGLLLPMEKEALRYAVSEKCMRKMGWIASENGLVKCSHSKMRIFPTGFTVAIKKVLEQIGDE